LFLSTGGVKEGEKRRYKKRRGVSFLKEKN
jgi:hypothetical protein